MSGLIAAGVVTTGAGATAKYFGSKSKQKQEIKDQPGAKAARNALGPQVTGGVTQTGNAYNKMVEPQETGLADAFLAGRPSGNGNFGSTNEIANQIATQQAALAIKKSPDEAANLAMAKSFGDVGAEVNKGFSSAVRSFIAQNSNPNMKSTTQEYKPNIISSIDQAGGQVMGGFADQERKAYYKALEDNRASMRIPTSVDANGNPVSVGQPNQ